ncbi:MAG: DUF1858 domain-containing protein [Firmicutes bacterium]|nr:DUF1858 domain-containing protein [Bacillota bacterium]
MNKIIDLKKSVYEICQEYPDAVGILAEVGFSEITKPGMLSTVGRVMTIPKGARMRGVNLAEVKSAFERHGFQVVE